VKTGSLATRVTLATLAMLVIVLAGVIAAVTIAYRSSREQDLANELRAAAESFQDKPPGDATKLLLANLSRQGIAVDFEPAAALLPNDKPGPGEQVTGTPQSARGKVDRASDLADAARTKPDPTGAEADSGVAPDSRISTQGSLVVLDQTEPDGTHVILSASNDAIAADLQQLLVIEGAVAAAVLVLAALMIRRVTAVALRPLADVSETATRIADGATTERLRPARTDTELGSMAAAFDHMVDTLEEAVSQSKGAEETMRRFLADASHELRTPIAALQASAETLLREQPRRPRRDAIEATIAGDAARLGRLVDDLLSLARLDAPLPGRSMTVDLARLAETTAADVDRRVTASEIALVRDGSVWIVGDPDALSRVIRNLLDNAVASSGPGGHVRLLVGRTPTEATLCVEDDGPGVPGDERERVFDRFVRLGAGTSSGSGLGLAIARRIARQHGGDLTCDEVDRGARFTLRLPSAPTADPAEPA
jgi:two-component system, OmpR family, sensor kinase